MSDPQIEQLPPAWISVESLRRATSKAEAFEILVADLDIAWGVFGRAMDNAEDHLTRAHSQLDCDIRAQWRPIRDRAAAASKLLAQLISALKESAS